MTISQNMISVTIVQSGLPVIEINPIGIQGPPGPEGPEGPQGDRGPAGKQFDGVIERTSDFTLTEAMAGQLINVNSEDPVLITLPEEAQVSIESLAVFTLQQVGLGVITISPATEFVQVSGVGLSSWAQYSFLQIIKEDSNAWKVIGGE
jgi:hypothetical protein